MDLEHFVTSAEFNLLPPGVGYSTLQEMYGDPDLLEPRRTARPMIVKYGDIEFVFRSDRLTTVSFSLEEGRPADGGAIPVRGFWPESTRILTALESLLHAHSVSWELDPLMSNIHSEESSQVWITERDVHLGFFQGYLQRVGADYLLRLSE